MRRNRGETGEEWSRDDVIWLRSKESLSNHLSKESTPRKQPNILFLNMLTITGLYVYPIKSLGGISLQEALVEERGFQYDRRWLLVDSNYRFLTQRVHPVMALLQVEILSGSLRVYRKDRPDMEILIPFSGNSGEEVGVQIWEDTCKAELVSVAADRWFSEMLGLDCHLVYMPDDSIRKCDLDYAANEEITGFSDGYPFLLLGQASLDDLNARLEEPVPINRFRPNIVFTGGAPYEEDDKVEYRVNDIRFRGVKPCARCVITTVNQDTAEKGKEPLKTLASYRTVDKKVLFGQNLLHEGRGIIRLGDIIVKGS